jgi:hypothetical protein
MPSRIYNYRCISSYSLHNLETDTVWLCSPDAYNAPYDCVYRLFQRPLIGPDSYQFSPKRT